MFAYPRQNQKERVSIMQNLNHLPEDKLNSLLNLAGKTLGRDPQQLRTELESGKLDNVMAKMDAKTAEKVNRVLQNPDAIKAALDNDKIKAMLNNLLEKKK